MRPIKCATDHRSQKFDFECPTDLQRRTKTLKSNNIHHSESLKPGAAAVPPSECEANKQSHPDLDERMNCADGGHSFVERVVVETLKRDRAVLCRPVTDLTDPQPTLATTRHSLTFRVRVATPARYGRNGTASLQVTSHTQQARRFPAKGAHEAPLFSGHVYCGHGCPSHLLQSSCVQTLHGIHILLLLAVYCMTLCR